MVGTGYLFTAVGDAEVLRAALSASAERLGLLGTILVAEEGVNLSVHGTPGSLDIFERELRELPGFEHFELRRSDDFGLAPFRRLKVQRRSEIVSLGRGGDALDHDGAVRVPPEHWEAQLDDEGVTVIDLRNDYEVAAGSFPGAVDPGTAGFREFPDWAEAHLPDKNAPVAMFCTGGIRCAKAAAWMRGRGWADVRELEGGILAYLEAVHPTESRWRGECFVFDERVSVVEGRAPGAGLRRGDTEVCHGCRRPLTEADREAPGYEPGVSCEHCRAAADEDELARRRERRRQVRLAEARGEDHLAPQQSGRGKGNGA